MTVDGVLGLFMAALVAFRFWCVLKPEKAERLLNPYGRPVDRWEMAAFWMFVIAVLGSMLLLKILVHLVDNS
jgi:ABC-type uncharacterized transport system permease subunit